jgi:hypothetical protein
MNQNEINEWNDGVEASGVRYTCSDGVRIQISVERAEMSAQKGFTDYLNSREDDPASYLVDGVLHGWQDFYVEKRFRTLKGLDQITAEIRNTRWKWRAEADSVLFFDDEEFSK